MTDQTITPAEIDTDFDKRLTDLAIRQRDALARVAVATEMRNKFYDLFIKPYEDEIAARLKEVDDIENGLRADLMAYFNETGDRAPHPSVTIRVKQRWAYDKDDALDFAVKAGLDCIRYSLIVRDFEKLIEKTEWTGAERVNAPEVVISKLGHLAIHADAKAAAAAPPVWGNDEQ